MRLLLTLAAVLPALFGHGPEWVEDAVIYQIYPSSYQDSNGDGIGDLPGITSRLDYVSSLGVDCIWLNPVFESDFVDGGYDVKDYYRVDPRFGTNEDMAELIRQAHERGLKVLLDLVAGHSSDKCNWFVQSASGRRSPYDDYYVWSNALPDREAEEKLALMLQEKDVMQSTKGKWMLSRYPRAKYYMKNFFACQPSLNFGFAHPDPAHPWEQGYDDPGPTAVRAELRRIIAFWYDMGVDGFRVDMAKSLIKNDPDLSVTTRLWREMRSWMDENYPGHVLMAEWGNAAECLNAGFNIDMALNSHRSPRRRMYFDLKHQADGGCYFYPDGGAPSLRDLYGEPWPEDRIDRSTSAEDMLRQYCDNMTAAFEATSQLGYFATITGNHDHLRPNTGRRNSPAQLKVMMAWVMSMPLPILYYGDEIGMRSLVGLPNVEGANHDGKERSGARTPMQWDASPSAGFSDADPSALYLPVCPEWTPASCYADYLEWKAAGCPGPVADGAPTVQAQDGVEGSLLEWTRSLIAMRKAHKAFHGKSAFIPLLTEGKPYPFVFLRSDGDETFLIALNPTDSRKKVRLKELLKSIPGAAEGTRIGGIGTVAVSGRASFHRGLILKNRLRMGPGSALVIKLKTGEV